MRVLFAFALLDAHTTDEYGGSRRWCANTAYGNSRGEISSNPHILLSFASMHLWLGFYVYFSANLVQFFVFEKPSLLFASFSLTHLHVFKNSLQCPVRTVEGRLRLSGAIPRLKNVIEHVFYRRFPSTKPIQTVFFFHRLETIPSICTNFLLVLLLLLCISLQNNNNY